MQVALKAISIHAPLRERRQIILPPRFLRPFQSTLPYGSDRVQLCIIGARQKFQSTLPYGSDPCRFSCLLTFLHISIHAPLRERPPAEYRFAGCSNFNPRSLTGATVIFGNYLPRRLHFNPRSLTGATRFRVVFGFQIGISIHAPLRERQPVCMMSRCTPLFQSTLPYGSD